MTTIEGKAIAVRHERIDEAAAGQRIDNYLLRIARGCPRATSIASCAAGEVRVNRRRVQQTYRLQEGDEVRIPPIRIAEATYAAPAPAASCRGGTRTRRRHRQALRQAGGGMAAAG